MSQVLIFDGPVFAAELEMKGEKFFLYFGDKDKPTTLEDVYADTRVMFGDVIPVERVRLAETFVERGFARFAEDTETTPSVEAVETEQSEV